MPPAPKAEIVAIVIEDVIHFYAASADATAALEAEGRTYGALLTPSQPSGAWTLYVSPLYSPAEVAEHFAPGNVTVKRVARVIARF